MKAKNAFCLSYWWNSESQSSSFKRFIFNLVHHISCMFRKEKKKKKTKNIQSAPARVIFPSFVSSSVDKPRDLKSVISHQSVYFVLHQSEHLFLSVPFLFFLRNLIK